MSVGQLADIHLPHASPSCRCCSQGPTRWSN